FATKLLLPVAAHTAARLERYRMASGLASKSTRNAWSTSSAGWIPDAEPGCLPAGHQRPVPLFTVSQLIRRDRAERGGVPSKPGRGVGKRIRALEPEATGRQRAE